jgi:hypothetical protein
MSVNPVIGILVSLMVVLAVTRSVSAQLAKQGTYTSQFSWHVMPKALPLEKDHTFFLDEYVGTNLNDAHQGFLHEAAVVCDGIVDLVAGVSHAQGYCTATDRDGDKAFSSYKCDSPKPGARCEGDFHWTGGTGKYIGLKGDNSFNAGTIPNTSSGYAIWKGEWALPQ